MASRDELQRLRDAIESVSNPNLKDHMLQALETFTSEQNSTSTSTSVNAPVTQPAADDSSDAVVVALRATEVTTKAPRDALFLAVHAILLETGFEVQDTTGGNALPLPANWDAHSATGLFTATYKHANDTSITFTLQGLFVGNKFEIYLSDTKNHTHSLELGVDQYVSLSASSSNAADLLQDLAALRVKLTPFLENLAPKKPVTRQSAAATAQPRPPPPGSEGGRGSGGFSPYIIPPVGRGDILPPGLGGGDPSTLVGPDHPMFGRRYDPTRGPVPGARFDPYGPFSTDPQGPPRGFIGGPQPMRPGPAPGFPFGEPNPDHLRMPRDDEMMDDPFGPRGGRRSGPSFPPQGRGGQPGADFPPPFGSGNSFF